MDEDLASRLSVNTPGRAPHISLRRREQLRLQAARRAERERQRRRRENSTSWASAVSTRFAFPLSPEKHYDFFTSINLHQFPESSVKAVQHFAKIIAPPLPGTTPFIFAITPDQVLALSTAFTENIQARWAFRKLLMIYRSNKMKLVNTTDPITLEPFKKPIQIPFLCPNTIVQFESRSLAKHWSTNLLSHDGLFIEPRFPTNPFTNLPLNVVQLHSALKEIPTDWVLDSFRVCQYDIPQWKKRFGVPLKQHCIEKVFADRGSYDRLDCLLDFVELQHQYFDLSFNKEMFEWIFLVNGNEEVSLYANSWTNICKKFYIEKYTIVDKDEMENLEIATNMESSKLLEVPRKIKILYFRSVARRKNNGGQTSSRGISRSGGEGGGSVSAESGRH